MNEPGRWPLLITKLLDHAASIHGDREIVTRTDEGALQHPSST